MLLTHVTVSPLQILISSGTKTSWPLSEPILTFLVSAAKPGALTAAFDRPKARPAARAMAARRVHMWSDLTTVCRSSLSASISSALTTLGFWPAETISTGPVREAAVLAQ